MNPSVDLIVVGSFVQDHIWLTDRFPVTGETRRGLGFATGAGGKGFNQAMAAHRQGARVLFIGVLGDDLLGRSAQAFAREAGLACRWQVQDEAATAASSIVVDADGRNQIVVALAANERLDPEFLYAQDAAFAGARVLLVQLENNLDAITAAIAQGRRHGLTVVLNPAPVHPQLDAALLADVDLATPNETEFSLLLQRIGAPDVAPERVAALSDDALHACARRIGVGTLVVTLGEHGCFVSHGSGSRHGQGEPDRYRIGPAPVRAIDSTGAGDAFNGALVAALLRDPGGGFRAAVEHANRSAALSTETVGTAPAMPTLEQVAARFDPR